MLSVLIFGTLLYIIFIPESPKWLYTWSHYQRAREVIRDIAKFNSSEPRRQRKLETLKYD